jgi:hypothetical protein
MQINKFSEIYIDIYIYIHTHIQLYIYIHIHTQTHIYLIIFYGGDRSKGEGGGEEYGMGGVGEKINFYKFLVGKHA